MNLVSNYFVDAMQINSSLNPCKLKVMVSISTYQFQMRSNENDDSAEIKNVYISGRMYKIYSCWTNDFALKMLFCSQQISQTQLFYENDDHGNDDNDDE